MALVFVCTFMTSLPVFAQSPTPAPTDETATEGISDEEKRTIYRGTNDIQHYDNKCSAAGGTSSSVQLSGKDNIEKVLKYLMDHGFTLAQAAGAVGNMQWESGSESLNPKGSDGVAHGIVQWQGGRLDNLKKYGGAQWEEIDTQIHFIGVEFGWEDPKGAQGGTEKAALPKILAIQGDQPEAAALAWENAYERSADTVGSIGWKTRQSNARKIFDQYKNGGVGTGGGAQSMAATSGGCPSGGQSGTVNADGYAFPVALAKDQVTNGTAWPCPGNCHHDGTPAFDLSKTAQDDSSENTPVIAIYKGKIQSFNNAYSGVSGCQSFQLVGDDGWWYWYGHVQSASVQDGAQVNAGQQIAVIGRRACTGNGSYPHLHIDRGSPQGHYGGSVCCRDSGMVPLINKLHDELGGGVPSVL